MNTLGLGSGCRQEASSSIKLASKNVIVFMLFKG
jgi:hypothetical protein